MQMKDVRKRAKAVGVKLETESKPDLIRAIQAAEGNPQCFQTGRVTCAEVLCCWMEDCVPQAKVSGTESRAKAGVGSRTVPWRK